MSDLKILEKDLIESLQKAANDNNALVLSFIAPDDVIKVSPASISYATIEPRDMYALEKTIESLKAKGELPKKLHLVIQTPGGALSTSFKIAKYLRENFEDIHAFVPYEAASGGTLMCLAANSITMGDLGNLTPIDPQVQYMNQRVSAYRMIEAVDDFERRFEKTRPHDIPSPWQQMGEKFDAVLYSEMNTVVFESLSYGARLLEKSGYEKNEAKKIAIRLARTPYTHGHCIDAEEAAEIGLRISKEKEDGRLLVIYKKWVSQRLGEKVDIHIIEHFSPVTVALDTKAPKAVVDEQKTSKELEIQVRNVKVKVPTKK